MKIIAINLRAVFAAARAVFFIIMKQETAKFVPDKRGWDASPHSAAWVVKLRQ